MYTVIISEEHTYVALVQAEGEACLLGVLGHAGLSRYRWRGLTVGRLVGLSPGSLVACAVDGLV